MATNDDVDPCQSFSQLAIQLNPDVGKANYEVALFLNQIIYGLLSYRDDILIYRGTIAGAARLMPRISGAPWNMENNGGIRSSPDESSRAPST